MNIPVVFACDNNYALPTAVAIGSLVSSKAKETNYEIHVLCNQVEPAHKRKLASLSRPGASVKLVDVNDRYRGQIAQRTHVTSTALLIFDLGILFPEYERLVYLDGDIIVNGDLTPLFQTSLNVHCAAAVKQMNIAELPPFNLDGSRRQFYTGVMLLDTAYMRNENLREQLFNTLKELDLGCHDQEAFNRVLGDKVTLVGPQFNYCNVNDMLCSIREACHHYGISATEWQQARRNPVVLHYVDGKPWLVRGCLREREWLRHWQRSPYAECPLQRKISLKLMTIRMLDRLLPYDRGRSFFRRLYAAHVKKDW